MIVNLKIPAYVVDAILSQEQGKSVTKYIMDMLKDSVRVPKEEQYENRESIPIDKGNCPGSSGKGDKC